MADILAAVAVVINGLPQGLLALSYGFAAFPTALGFVAGIVGALAFGSVAPISFQAESIVLAGTIGRTRNERCTIVVLTGLTMALVGAMGLLEPTIAFIGPAIENGMMAGVGIILAIVAINMVKTNPKAGFVSVGVAVMVYIISTDLVWTIVTSVAAATAVSLVRGRRAKADAPISLENEAFRRVPMVFNSRVIRGSLAMICLQIGGNIAYAGITGGIANTAVNVDHVTLYSGIGDALSAYFGGGPIEAIISGTGAAPNPFFAGILMMAIMTVILLMKLLPILARRVPSESIAGFLLVLGAIVVFPVNAGAAIGADPIVGGIATVVTAATDPFIGLLAGVIVRALMSVAGV